MIEVLKQALSKIKETPKQICAMREELQKLILQAVFDNDCSNNIAFVGGTALRLFYNINRYSEDLDFSLVKKDNYDFIALNKNIINFFALHTITLESEPNAGKTVNSAFFKFPDIMQKAGLKVPKNQKLSIKFEIDTNPPKGANTEVLKFSKVYAFNTTVFDIHSMFAGKLHACYCRKYTKGRDFYDLMWYLGNKTEPNFVLLNNAIKQTEGENLKIDENNINDFIEEIIRKTDFPKAQKDVSPFLFYPEEAKAVNADSFYSLLARYKRDSNAFMNFLKNK